MALGIAFPTTPIITPPEMVDLDVPFVTEIPDGQWTAPWNNACEEASVTMVDQYYLGVKEISRAESKKLMWPLFAAEIKLFGYNADTNAEETAELAENMLDFAITIKDNPTLEDIKNELRNKRPVISMHYGFALNNPALRFRREGSSFHMMVISGFDDKTQEFIVEDPGNPNGVDFRYKYDNIMSTLHDFNHKDKKADGPARVLFTSEKMLAKAAGGTRIFLIKDNKKHYIAHPDLFKKYGWSWTKVKSVDKSFLDNLENGEAIRN